jgi:ribosomal protein S18 acetylase RimI-like enzyme
MKSKGYEPLKVLVESHALDREDCRALSEIALAARKGTPLETGKSLKETAASIEKLSTNKDFHILIAKDEQDTIVGWTYDYVAFPLMTFISGFFPLVDPTHDPEEIALALIDAEKRKISGYGHTRLELELVLQTKAHRELSKEVIEWYHKSGFQFAAEEAHMTTNLETVKLPDMDPPGNHTLTPFTEFSYDQLEGPGFQVFKTSQDDLFLSMSVAEQQVTLKHFFDQSSPLIEEACLVLQEDSTITGFVITKKAGEGANIGPIGLVPEARGQGLGNYLLVTTLRRIKDTGINTVSLDMSISNHPAQRLYQRYGFQDAYHKQFYYWSPR